MNLDSIIKNLDPVVSNILNKVLDGNNITQDETIELFNSRGMELNMIAFVANHLCKRKKGDIVTYVINRNINFTNVCIKRCGFCAFSRDFREEEGYFLPIEEIVRRAKEAEKIGAVNTINFENGEIIGYNTDYLGFGMLLDKKGISVNNEATVILGTGGASKAIYQYLVDNNAKEVVFVSRDAVKAKERNSDHKVIEYSDLKHLKTSGIIINCTPVGMYPEMEDSPIDKVFFDKFHTAVDVIYNPRETMFLNEAKQQGLKAINGLHMLIGQAIKAQEIWNNIEISDAITERVYRETKIFHSRR